MIPKNITREIVLKAIDKINLEGVPKARESTEYNLKYLGILYPPKYTLSLANLFANGKELKPDEFTGGIESNGFLIQLGFEIVNVNRELRNSNDAPESEIKESNNVNIATVTIQTYKKMYATEKERELLLEKVIEHVGEYADIILLPAKFYYSEGKSRELYTNIENHITEYLRNRNLTTTICLGVDGDNQIDQIGLAINKTGIVTIARKFYPTDGELNCVDLAKDYLDTEDGYSRILQVKGKKFYMAMTALG